MRILIVDDHPLYLDAAQGQIKRGIPDSETVTGRSVSDALDHLRDCGPFDLVVLDYSMPGMDDGDGLRGVVDAATPAPVAVMSGMASPENVAACIRAGAKGFLPKTLEGPVFQAAVNTILLGGTYLPIEYIGSALLATSAPADGPSPMAAPAPPPYPASGPASTGEQGVDDSVKELSQREMEVLRLLARGATNKEIALSLDVQEVTVKLHATRIFTKLGVRNRSQAAVKALRLGIVSQ